MRIYWGEASIPELAALPKKEQMRIWLLVCGKPYRHWQTWAVLLSCLSITGKLQRIMGPSGLWIVSVIIGYGITALLLRQVTMHLARPYIREQIAAEDALRASEEAADSANFKVKAHAMPSGRE